MDKDAIAEAFELVGRVTLRRMFGGHGVYKDGVIFALEFDGALWLKADDGNRPRLERMGSQPFTYAKAGSETTVTSYWSLPETALDDPDEMRSLAIEAIAAGERARLKAAKPRKRPR